ncbi:MAG: condensation domain-containing protein, partial [Pseudomonadota bacterium]
MNTPFSIDPKGLRLTAIQRSLLASHYNFPDNGHQNAALTIQFSEPVDPVRLAHAFDSVVTRSDVLRSVFADRKLGGVALTAGPPAPTLIRYASADEFADWCAQNARRPLDLSKACYESVIAVHPDQTATWYLNLHHVINDGPSAAFVLKAVDAEYSGDPLPLDSYYGRERMGTSLADVAGTARKHWQERQARSRLDYVYGHLRRSSADAEQWTVLQGAAFNTMLEHGLADSFRLLTPGLSRGAFWVFATALYLHRLSGADSFSVGAIVNQRERLSAQNTIGPFIEIFPVDIDVRADDTHRTLFARVA